MNSTVSPSRHSGMRHQGLTAVGQRVRHTSMVRNVKIALAAWPYYCCIHMPTFSIVWVWMANCVSVMTVHHSCWKWCNLINCNWCISLDISLILDLNLIIQSTQHANATVDSQPGCIYKLTCYRKIPYHKVSTYVLWYFHITVLYSNRGPGGQNIILTNIIKAIPCFVYDKGKPHTPLCLATKWQCDAGNVKFSQQGLTCYC